MLVGRAGIAPQLVEDPIRRQHARGVHQQQGEQSSLSLASEVHRLAVPKDFKAAEESELDPHRSPFVRMLEPVGEPLNETMVSAP